MNYPKNRKSSSRAGCNKGVPKPPIERVCRVCSKTYVGFNGTRYCSDKCRFEASISYSDNGCWEWRGYKRKRARYGEFYTKDAQRILAHRASYLLLKGEEPGQLSVMHKCDNPSCVNPEHLALGTHQDNMRDRDTKGRQARGETSASAKLTENDVRAIRADTRGCRRLARAYGVGVSAIVSVRNRTTWKHVDG